MEVICHVGVEVNGGHMSEWGRSTVGVEVSWGGGQWRWMSMVVEFSLMEQDVS